MSNLRNSQPQGTTLVQPNQGVPLTSAQPVISSSPVYGGYPQGLGTAPTYAPGLATTAPTYAPGLGTSVIGSQPYTTYAPGAYTTAVPSYAPATTNYVQPSQVVGQYAQPPASSQIVGQTQGAPIKGESRIEYVPYTKEVTEYVTQEVVEYVPREKKVTDYYVVEHAVEYIPQVYQEKYIEYQPVEQLRERVEYQAVERQTVVQQPQFNQEVVTQPVQYTQQAQYVTQPVTYGATNVSYAPQTQVIQGGIRGSRGTTVPFGGYGATTVGYGAPVGGVQYGGLPTTYGGPVGGVAYGGAPGGVTYGGAPGGIVGGGFAGGQPVRGSVLSPQGIRGSQFR